jgi:Tfp pilus tip-associated adhesin PilY1
VVKAVSSPRGVVVPPRSATRKSASSTGAPASTHPIAALTGCPASGAVAAPDVGEADDREVVVVRCVLCDGVIGVNSVGPGLLAGTTEQPATSMDAAKTTAMRIRPG